MVRVVLHSILSWRFFVGYFGLGIACFVALPATLPWVSWSKSFVMTLGLMTGTDPYSFKDHIESYPIVWTLVWLIHIASWLLIPALIALIITEAKTQLRDEENLKRGLREWLENLGIKNVDGAMISLLNEINQSKTSKSKEGKR